MHANPRLQCAGALRSIEGALQRGPREEVARALECTLAQQC